MVGDVSGSRFEESLGGGDGEIRGVLARLGASVEEIEGRIGVGSDPEVELEKLGEAGEEIEGVAFRLGGHGRLRDGEVREAEELLEKLGRVREGAELKAEEAAADPLRGR